MPDPPSSGLLTRFVFENPYPLVILLIVGAVLLAFSSRQDILGGRMRAAGASLLAAVVVLFVGTVIKTPGERSADVVREFIQLVKEGAIARADNLIGADCLAIDILRCKLSFFGASKFDPKSDRWTRINMYQGAPLFDEITNADADDWWLPVSEFV